MFRKLRNKLILINLGITTAVVVVAFTAVYLFSTHSASQRPPIPENEINFFTDDIENIVRISLNNEKQLAARDLLMLLTMSGLAIELAVALVSYFLAEMAIKPVREAYDSQKVFIANASHEIKTPLAAISANLEAADIQGNKWISNVEKEVIKLSTLNNELLSLARSDLVVESGIREVDLNEIVEGLLDSFESRMRRIKLTVNNGVHGKTKIAAEDFTQIFNILMDNAIKYCNEKINVKITNHELMIGNDGTIITEQEKKHIFDRFYQVDKSAEGVGLGLSIAKSLAERRGWSLSAGTNNGMTEFILKF